MLRYPVYGVYGSFVTFDLFFLPEILVTIEEIVQLELWLGVEQLLQPNILENVFKCICLLSTCNQISKSFLLTRRKVKTR